MTTITEDYVSFETAKLLKEKGFDEFTISFYDKNGSIGFNEVDTRVSDGYQRPTLQMTMKWLREVHKLHIWFGFNATKGLPWYYEIHSMRDGRVKHIGDIVCGSYEQACEAAIKYCLENLI